MVNRQEAAFCVNGSGRLLNINLRLESLIDFSKCIEYLHGKIHQKNRSALVKSYQRC